MDVNLLNLLKKDERLFIVDLENVSIYSQEGLNKITLDNEKYIRTPFLFLLASYIRNESIFWADKKLKYEQKRKIGSWCVYSFRKVN